jgi:hypothetical protein
MGIPSQETADMNNAEEHFVWALRNMPMLGKVGAIMHPSYLTQWSQHLWDCGFVHASHIEKQAVDGVFDIQKLPKQKIKFQEAQRGPHHTWNPASHWVPIEKEDPKPVRVPNVQNMTIQERHALIAQLETLGLVKEGVIEPDMAEEEASS